VLLIDYVNSSMDKQIPQEIADRIEYSTSAWDPQGHEKKVQSIAPVFDACEDCGLACVVTRTILIKKQVSRKKHWKRSCNICKKIAIDDGMYEFTQATYEVECQRYHDSGALKANQDPNAVKRGRPLGSKTKLKSLINTVD